MSDPHGDCSIEFCHKKMTIGQHDVPLRMIVITKTQTTFIKSYVA
jgi:hypothetical protein